MGDTIVGEMFWPVATNFIYFKHTQIKNNNKAWIRGWGLVALKSANVLNFLVFPRRTLRHRECFSARWYSTPLHLRRVDEHSQKTYGRRKRQGRRIPLKGQGSPKVQKNSACIGLTKNVQRGAYSCNTWISQPLLQLRNYDRCCSSHFSTLCLRFVIQS